MLLHTPVSIKNGFDGSAFMPMVKNVLTPTNALPTISAQLRQTVSINFEHICLVVRLVTLVTV